MSEASRKVLTRMLIFRFRFEHRYGERLTKVRGLDGLPFPASGENSWKIRICIILFHCHSGRLFAESPFSRTGSRRGNNQGMLGDPAFQRLVSDILPIHLCIPLCSLLY